MPRTHRPSPPEFRAEAVRLARRSDKSIPALAADLGVSAEALRHWLRQADADEGRGQPGELTTDEREELRRLRREVRGLQQEREILRKAAAYFAKETLSGCRPNNCLAHLNRYCARSDCSNCLLKADGVAVLDVQTPTWAETLFILLVLGCSSSLTPQPSRRFPPGRYLTGWFLMSSH